MTVRRPDGTTLISGGAAREVRLRASVAVHRPDMKMAGHRMRPTDLRAVGGPTRSCVVLPRRSVREVYLAAAIRVHDEDVVVTAVRMSARENDPGTVGRPARSEISGCRAWNR